MEQALENWLRKKVRLLLAQNIFLGLFLLIGGVLVLAATFFLASGIIWFVCNVGLKAVVQLCAGKSIELSRMQIYGGGAAFLVLLFIQELKTTRDYWGTYQLQNSSMAALGYTGGVFGSILAVAANPDATGKMVSDVLLTGPRLVLGVFKLFRRAGALRALDTKGCAQALAVLLHSGHRVSCEDLAPALEGYDVAQVYAQLQGIEGVLFLSSEEAGFTLTSDLRDELTSTLA